MRLRRPGVVVVLALVAALSSCAQASTEETSTAGSPTGSPSRAPEQPTPVETVPPRDTDGLTPQLSAAAEAFVAFAAAGDRQSPPVPWAEEVRLVSGREALATLDADAAGRRESWLGCPQVARDSGYTCPVSPLRSLAGLAADDEVTTGTDRPEVIGCQRVAPARDTSDLRGVTLMPPGGGSSCFDAFLVTLYLDDADRVATVDWQLSGP